MTKDDLVQELDRNMDAVFDAVRVLNSAMSAMVLSLAPETATTFTRHMDKAIDDLKSESQRLGMSAHQQLHGWRNQAGSIAGLPVRRPY